MTRYNKLLYFKFFTPAVLYWIESVGIFIYIYIDTQFLKKVKLLYIFCVGLVYLSLSFSKYKIQLIEQTMQFV